MKRKELKLMNNCATYSVKEVASILGVSVCKVYQLIRQNKIPNIKLDKCSLIPRNSFEVWFSKSIQGVSL